VREALALRDRQASAHPGPRRRGPRFTVGGAAGRHALSWPFVRTLTARSAPVCRAGSERARRGSWHGLLARRCMLQAADRGRQPATDIHSLPCHSRGHGIIPGRGHCMSLLCRMQRIAAYACARARTPRPGRRMRGRALSRRLKRAAPPPRALRPTGPRATTAPCWFRGPCSRVRSGRPGQRPPRRRAPLDAMGQRSRGCPPSAGAASATRRPRPSRMLGAQGRRHAASAARARVRQALHTPCPAVPGAQRPLRRRRSMPVRARCGQGWRLGANLVQRAQAARPSGQRPGQRRRPLQHSRRMCGWLGGGGRDRAHGGAS